jgi:transposase-like protein
LVLAAALVVAAGTGCSGNGQANGTGTTTVPTRPKPLPNQSRWAKQVDAACKPWQKRINAVTPAPTTTATLRIWFARARPLIRKQLAAIKAVKPPANQDEARKVTRFVNSLQRTERALTRYLAASRANAPAEARSALDEASASGAAARAQAASLHVTKCSG